MNQQQANVTSVFVPGRKLKNQRGVTGAHLDGSSSTNTVIELHIQNGGVSSYWFNKTDFTFHHQLGSTGCKFSADLADIC